METSIANPSSPMPIPAHPETPESVARERAYCSARRREIGLDPDPDAAPLQLRPLDLLVLSEGHSLESRVRCAEAIDLAVETYGLELVVRAVRLVAAANGRVL